MRRCQPHNVLVPCFYCERGLPSFESIVERLDVLEDRMLQVERNRRTFVDLNLAETNVVVRQGGLGDLVMLTPGLRALKKKEPKRPLVLATSRENIPLLEGAPYLDGVIPLEQWVGTEFQHCYDLRYAVEPPELGGGKLPWQDYCSKDRSDIFDEALGVKNGHRTFKVFGLPVNSQSWWKLKTLLDKSPRPRIGLAATCKSVVKCVPPDYISPLVAHLIPEFQGTVVLFGQTDGWNRELSGIRGAGVVNLIDQLSLQEAVALVSLMDIVVSPDSAPTHFAGALGVKCVALFGSIAPKTMTKYYPTVKSLYPEGELSCIPCGGQISCQMAEGRFGAECMRLLTPERIVAATRESLHG